MKIKVFISWSGELAKKVGQELSNWLPNILQNVEPYFSPDSLEKGIGWYENISDNLKDAKVGIICISKSNIDSPWLLFEAGALANKLVTSKVCPLLIDIQNSELGNPLALFQCTELAREEDFKKLIMSINKEMGKSGIEPANLDVTFDKWKGDFFDKIEEIKKKSTNIPEIAKPPKDREILDFINEKVTRIEKRDMYLQDKIMDVLEMSHLSSRKLSGRFGGKYDEEAMIAGMMLRGMPIDMIIERVEGLMPSEMVFDMIEHAAKKLDRYSRKDPHFSKQIEMARKRIE